MTSCDNPGRSACSILIQRTIKRRSILLFNIFAVCNGKQYHDGAPVFVCEAGDEFC